MIDLSADISAPRQSLQLLMLVVATAFPFGGRVVADDVPAPLPEASAGELPRWRGFNLPYRYNVDSRPGPHNRPLTEEPMRLIALLGFNFVRLPLDYRFWIEGGDWHAIDEDSVVLREIDQVVACGEKYGIHVSINFHKAPGYCVNGLPEETPSLWESEDAQAACAEHWAFFARRYRDVPNRRLSFNLWNEPKGTDAETHARVARFVVDAIRREDPDRLIICDGFQFKPAEELIPLGVAQAARGYTPGQITHYKASWWGGNRKWETPVWPWPLAHGWLHAQSNVENPHASLTIRGPLPAGPLHIQVGDVFHRAILVAEADGVVIWRKEFTTGPMGQGEWQESQYHEQWKNYQCIYDRSYAIDLPEGADELRLYLSEGNWIGLTELAVTGEDGTRQAIRLDPAWGTQPDTLVYDPDSKAGPWKAPVMQDRAWLMEETVRPWVELRERGVGVMVGEFGVYNKTPHDVTLAFLEDCLANYREVGFGWALWNLDGAFGVLDSQREDVDYENFHGHKLDRKMLELLQRY